MKRSIQLTLAAAAAVIGLGTLAQRATVAEDAKNQITLQVLNWEQTLDLVKAQKGKIVVLDAWSTSCQPCKEEFPNLVKLHEKHGKDVACLSMSCDYAGIKNKPPEFYRERVLKFLTQQRATFPNVLSSVPADELFDKMKLGAIPAVYVFDRDGKLAKRFDNDSIKSEDEAFTYRDVNKLVEQLLAKK
jgi:thiol-disulfide isomerase/thioredoxin